MQITRKSFEEKSKKKIREWILSSSSHGFPNIFKNTNIVIRLMWTVVFIASFSYCAYTIINSIVQYSKYETTVSIVKIQELPQVFPAITLCNLNIYNESYSELDLYYELVLRTYSNPICFDLWNKTQLCNQNRLIDNVTNCSEIKNECYDTYNYEDPSENEIKSIIAKYVNANLFDKNNIGSQLNDLNMYKCQFNNEKFYARDFQKRWSNKYGFCYTFNSGYNNTKLLSISNKGKDYGFEIEIAVEAYVEETRFARTSGLYLIVHNESDSFDAIIHNGVILQGGRYAYVGVDRVFNYKQPSPYSDCIDELKSDNTYAQRLFSYFKYLNISNYNQDLCQDLCYQDQLIDECGCSNFKFPALRNTDYCYKQSEFDCLYSFENKFSTSDTNIFCKNACPEKCTTIEYQTNIEYSSYQNVAHIDNLWYYFVFELSWEWTVENYIKFKDNVEKNLMRIKINYANKFYTKITESASITFESLIGNIGGQLGLFIGISLLSVIEVFELCIELIILYIQHKREKPQQPAFQPPIFFFNRNI